MTHNVDLRCHPGLNLDECTSIHRYYEPTKFHQNQTGSGQLVIHLTWNDPESNETILICQAIIPTKISISLTENEFSFLIFQEETLPFLVTFPKMDMPVAIFGNVSKKWIITKI